MTLRELIEKKNALVKEAQAILQNEDELTDEDVTRAQDLTDEVESLNKRISQLRELADAETAHADYAPVRPTLPGEGEGTIPNATPQPAEDSPEVRGQKALQGFFVKKFGNTDTAMKAILTDAYGSVDSWMAQRVEQMELFNRYLRDVRWEPSGIDARLLRKTILSPREVEAAIARGATFGMLKATMVEADDLLGGYAVPPDYRNLIIERLAATARIRPLCTVETTSRDILQKPKSTGGDTQFPNAVRITWVDETPSSGAASTNLTFGMEQIPVNTAMAVTPVSRNLVEDSAYDLVGHLTRSFGEAFAIDEDNQFVNGDGVGKPQGLLVGGSNTNSITEVVSGDANLVQWFDTASSSQGLIALSFGVAAQYRDNARWLFERATARDIAAIDDGNNRPYWSQEEIGAGMLLRYPYVEHEGMPTIAANAYPILFGDFRGYTIADRVGVTVERYLDSATAETNTVKYVARRRVGGKCTEAYRFAVLKVSAS